MAVSEQSKRQAQEPEQQFSGRIVPQILAVIHAALSRCEMEMAHGYNCGRIAPTECCDCGMKVCYQHVTTYLGEVYCQGCADWQKGLR